ncbi:MAG: ABC-F family ATP-binding cassette domain-containing protein [Candidatus Marinimicrobia bacterium]|jgi:ATP-binding cassette, subfamily F, member 3|nr:ABC-F family ATP-binding cassette domain-containing protein [Candidatus Neomarinimicrobiota bacterium]MBT3826173.1 ABC-F family ATP-binding cassette domain-containing protein [Candidatus Neomarinimicrobiota bacterium]MBT4130889.1 ABC-F family ATP-binding cassette domain-containing protein [Candidatus Neomarinimicrobiota bacterium]MBT4295682.1 ABC-F family ATP-binding cassette domain-containing protein [Candidatus Neomarinimicrobiota bacterium]MBT4421376.1 ABC-F family ATP-binding cassette do
MINLHNITKTYPDKTLFKGLDLVIKRGSRIGLVGANGSGKTTLLRMIVGEEDTDKGQIQVDRKITIGYLPQEITATSEETILHEVLNEIPEVGELEIQIENLSLQIAANPDDELLLNRLGQIQAEFERLNGWSLESDAKKVLGGLGFSPEQMKVPLDQFSGGWRMRVALAKLLFKHPDILLLDEPTNHLDLASLIWLETFLKEWSGALVLISHDRTFLDKTINHIFEIEHMSIQIYAGNYSKYIEEKKLRLDQQLAAYRNQQKLIAETERFIERFRYKDSKASQVQSRVKKLEKLVRISPPEGEQSRISVRIPQPGRSARTIAEFKGVAKFYGKLEVFNQLNLTLERGQKIGLVGPNGAGKSTLLKMLAQVEPLSGGDLVWGEGVESAYFAQHQFESLPMESNIYDLISNENPKWIVTEVRTYLGSFLFSGETVDKKIKVLSGGEVSRLALARMLSTPSDLILLDEPTNHLDMRSRDVVQEAISSFQGTMVCISHDRHFLNAVTNTIIEVEQGRIRIFPGNYEYYLWRKGQDRVEVAERMSKIQSTSLQKPSNQDYQNRKKLTNRYKKLPRLILECETAISNQDKIMIDPAFSSEYGKIQAAIAEKEVLEEKYLELLEELETLKQLLI